MLFYSILNRVLRECADTSSCQEFIEHNGKVWAVISNQDIRQYAEDKRLGTFAGKAKCRWAFVESGGDGRCWTDRDSDHETAVRLFREGRLNY